MAKRILIVDDEQSIRTRFAKYLGRKGFDVQEAGCLSEAREALAEKKCDAILLDLELPDGKGIDWVEEVRGEHQDIAIIMITAYGDVPLAVEAMQRGVDNFLTKPVELADLLVFLQKSLELSTLRKGHIAQSRLAKSRKYFFGKGVLAAQMLEVARLAAEGESPVLLQGETGTGKSVLARWIHDESQRSPEPFVEINCSGLRGEMLASELFGHVKGAFTSAIQDKQGLIDLADGGTLFLDEIGDMDVELQAHLLKVIEEKTYRRIGDVKMKKSNFRLMCATNMDLQRMASEGAFREDLLYRLNVLSIDVPAVREMKDDLPSLIQFLLTDLGREPESLAPEGMDKLLAYDWPGNIREMRNVLERASILSRGNVIQVHHLPSLAAGAHRSTSTSSTLNLEELQGISIQEAIRKAGGDKSKAARILGISRATLYRKLKEL